MSGSFNIYPSSGQWRWRLVSSNGRIIATAGEAYVNYADCENSVNIVKTAGRENWNVYDDPNRYRKSFCVFKDTAGEYRWRLYAENGPIVAVSSEGYSVRAGALDSVALTKSAWSWPTFKQAA